MSFSSHGGNLNQEAHRLGIPLEEVLDASASLVPFPLPRVLRKCLKRSLFGSALRNYPDSSHKAFRESLASWHAIDSRMILPGNGAAELFTWAARDAGQIGVSGLPEPCFGDYVRALRCWNSTYSAHSLPLRWSEKAPQAFPLSPKTEVLWITNPHNPTGQLWSVDSLKPLLRSYDLVICDEAFLPLVPNGESQSLIPFVDDYPNLVVIRSLTKLFGIAGLRLGYAVGDPERLERWSQWRDPWPVNGLALAVGTELMQKVSDLDDWILKVQNWVAKEGLWFQTQLSRFPMIIPHPSAANFLLIQGERSLLPVREKMALKKILLRDCRSFSSLGDHWLRISFKQRRDNQRILVALREALTSP